MKTILAILILTFIPAVPAQTKYDRQINFEIDSLLEKLFPPNKRRDQEWLSVGPESVNGIAQSYLGLLIDQRQQELELLMR
jgi:hypothetical protein